MGLNNNQYRDLFFKGNHFNALALSPGTLRAKEIRGQVVASKETTESKIFSVSDLSLGSKKSNLSSSSSHGINKKPEFDLGTQLQYRNLRSAKMQDNNPSIIGDWEFGTVSTSSNITSSNSNEDVAGAKADFRAGAGINRDPKQMQSRIEEQHSGLFFAYSHGVFKDLVNDDRVESPIKNSKSELLQQKKVIAKIIDQYHLAEIGELTLKQNLLYKIKKQLQIQALITAENGGSFDLKEAFSYVKSKISSSSMEEVQSMQRAYDYSLWLNTQSQIRNFQLTSTDRPQSTEITMDNQNSYLDPENIEIMGHTVAGQALAKILVCATQAGVGLAKKIPSAYANWDDKQVAQLKELQGLYGDEASDFEAYLHKQQAELLAKYTAIAKSRENFDSGNVVTENSVSVELQPSSKSLTSAFDIFRLGSKSINVGLTTFSTEETSLNPLELSSSSGLNSSASVSNHFGTNVAQIRSKFFDFNINVLTCNSNFTVNKLLSSLSPEVQLYCSAVDAIVTVPKVEILCAFSKCLEIEGSGSLKFGKARIISGDKIKQIKIEDNPGVSIEGQLDIKIVDKPNKKP